MANLQSYIDFSIKFDKSVSTPVIRLTDPNLYPVGIGVYVTGIFSIKQPDGITITGSFTSPDIYWSSSGFVVAEKELRLATDGSLQNGTYVFTYTVRCTGYDDTILVKTFVLNYATPSVLITDLTDVFTPALQQLDSTVYSQANFTAGTPTRAWIADILYVGSVVQSVTGTAIMFDMAYSGSYYDAHYNISFSSVFTSTGVLLTYLTIKDKITALKQIDAYTPPTLAVLLTGLTTLKLAIEAGTYCGGCGCGCTPDYAPYTLAVSIYDNIIARGLNGDTVGLSDYVDQLLKIFNCSGILNQTQTYVAIPAYNFGNSGSSGIHAPIQFTVDSGGTYAPASGTQDYVNPTIAGNNNYIIYRQAIADWLVEGVDFNYRTEGGFTLLASTFVSTERFTLAFNA